jgi:hypothetical protein
MRPVVQRWQFIGIRLNEEIGGGIEQARVGVIISEEHVDEARPGTVWLRGDQLVLENGIWCVRPADAAGCGNVELVRGSFLHGLRRGQARM